MARTRGKENNFKFSWVLHSKSFAQQSQGSMTIHITDTEALELIARKQIASLFRLNNLQSFLEIFTTSACSLTLYYVNIRNLRKHRDEFQLAIKSVLPITDAFVLTEINISNKSTDQSFLPGFKSIFYTRDKRRGAGIAVFFFKQELIFLHIQVAFWSSESIALRVLTPISDLCLLAFYRLPLKKFPNF